MYSIALHLGGGLWAICEVQVHLAAILAHKEASHKDYEFFRACAPPPPPAPWSRAAPAYRRVRCVRAAQTFAAASPTSRA